MPTPYTALVYDYVSDVLERRGPYRDAHLALLADLHARGVVVMAGATGAPVSGGLIIFRGESIASARAFVDADPYVANGIVTSYRIEPWTVVVP
jgi:uncharacterized protein YciI